MDFETVPAPAFGHALRGLSLNFLVREVGREAACTRAAGFAGAVVLQAAVDKPAHGLREAVILSPHGYAWVPSRRI